MTFIKCPTCHQPKLLNCWKRFNQEACDECVLTGRRNSQRAKRRARVQKREEARQKRLQRLSERDEAMSTLSQRMAENYWYTVTQVARITGLPHGIVHRALNEMQRRCDLVVAITKPR